MKTGPFKIDRVNTSHGLQYNIIDRRDGTIYATTYDLPSAEICCKALNTYYPAKVIYVFRKV